MGFEDVKAGYRDLFDSCVITSSKSPAVNAIVDKILNNESRYRKVEDRSGVPWAVIGAIHSMESSLNFSTHLHNGDPLKNKTVHVPGGRPPGNPPFDWEYSAADALQMKKLNTWKEWTVPGALYILERYNGWGYRKRKINTPYLWSYSNHYKKGKFVADHKFDPDAVSKQCGGAVILKAMFDRGVDTGINDAPDQTVQKPVAETEIEDSPDYPGRVIRIGENDHQIVGAIQKRLGQLGCGPLTVSGFFDSDTDAAVRLFQARFTDIFERPLEIDGIVGSLTWGALFGEGSVPFVEPSGDAFLDRVVKVAESQIGVKEDYPYRNSGAEVEMYLDSVGLGKGYAWCMAFVYWCFEKAAQEMGRPNPAVKTAGVLNHWNRAGELNIPRIKRDQAADDPLLVKPGMIFIIDTGAPGGNGHTGLVEKVTGGRLTTIEGNTNKGGSREGIGVFRRTSRKIASINKGFIDYSDF